jgi:hypothetical protein
MIPIGQEAVWALDPVWTICRCGHFLTFTGLEPRPHGFQACSQSLTAFQKTLILILFRVDGTELRIP